MAVRKHGVCTGTLWRLSNEKTCCDYGVLTGCVLQCFENRSAFVRGDFSLVQLTVVGASAQLDAKQGGLVHAFRLVTNQGTHLQCQATSKNCRDVWLVAFQAGLELALLSGNNQRVGAYAPPVVSHPSKHKSRGLPLPMLNLTPKRYCLSCGAVEGTTTGPASPLAGNSSALRSSSCSATQTTATTATKTINAAVAPMPHYGWEARVDLCMDCETAQGVLNHAEFYETALLTAQQERLALQNARAVVWKTVFFTSAAVDSIEAFLHAENNEESVNNIIAGAPAVEEPKDEEGTEIVGAGPTEPLEDDNIGGVDSKEAKLDEVVLHTDEAATVEQDNSSAADPTLTDVVLDCTSPDHSSESWCQVGSDTTSSPPPLGEGNVNVGSWEDPQDWIHLLPTESSTRELMQLLQDPLQFGVYCQISPFLESITADVLAGRIGVADFMEQLDEASTRLLLQDDSQAALKKQAFRVAGDMGSAMKLLLDSALPARDNVSIAPLVCVLDFLLDLCEEGELSTVSFFWPQMCHVHLRMLPPEDAAQVARVELVEDFLLTVSARYSIHLALELIWSHTADLEESLFSPTCSFYCRRRRFAVVRFVCELESTLFDFEDCWGGGSVSLGKMLSPTGHQVTLLKERMRHIQELRKARPVRLVRSSRFDLLTRAKLEKPPVEAANEKLRIAKNADYFSCHLNFSRRLADIAEKLHHMDIDNRASVLEEELNLLNSSGTMGGDPLNNLDDSLVRVVRVPSTEGHVFRSKERTPVLLLMEVVDEGAEVSPGDIASNARKKMQHFSHTACEMSGQEPRDALVELGQPSQVQDIVPMRPASPLDTYEGTLRPSPKRKSFS
jgi:hypothetical protein